MGIYLKWTQEELDYLTTSYAYTPNDTLRQYLRGRKANTINKKAEILGLKKNIPHLCKAEKLLQQTPEAYYWIGFLLADGSINERQIFLKIAKKDKPHLLRFRKFLESDNRVAERDNVCVISFTNVNVVSKLRSQYKITNDKTHFPCEIDQIVDDNLLFSLIIGFIDGDGSIYAHKHSKSYKLSVVGYHAWLSNFEYMEDNLYRICGFKPQRSAYIREVNATKPNLLVRGRFRTANFYICRRDVLTIMKEKVVQLSLPVLARKWDKIQHCAA